MAEVVQLPPSFRGQADNIPLAALRAPYAQRVINLNLDTGEAVLRKGDLLHATKANTPMLLVATYGFGSTQKLFAVWDGGNGVGLTVSDASAAGAMSSVYAPGGNGGDGELHSLEFNNYLILFGNVTWIIGGVGLPQWSGSAWSINGWTFPTITKPFGGAVHKNRAYLISYNDTKYAYTSINAISGACVEVDLGQIMSTRSYLLGIRSIALSEGIQQDNVCCFVTAAGEVLAYAGSYPDSATWQLVGRFRISEPLYYNAFVDARGDSYVITKTGLISLRALFAKGPEQALADAISAPMQNRWKQIFSYDWEGAALHVRIRGVYDAINDRLVINLPWYIEPSTGAATNTKTMRLVYSFRTGAWWEHVGTITFPHLVTNPVYYKQAVYYGIHGGALKAEGATDYMDDTAAGSEVAYSFELLSAPVSDNRAYVQKAEGLDPIVQSDLHATTDYTIVSDLGVTETVAQKLPSGTLTSLQRPNVNIGAEGTYLQYRINGTTAASKSVGYTLKGVNFYSTTGRSAR